MGFDGGLSLDEGVRESSAAEGYTRGRNHLTDSRRADGVGEPVIVDNRGLGCEFRKCLGTERMLRFVEWFFEKSECSRWICNFE